MFSRKVDIFVKDVRGQSIDRELLATSELLHAETLQTVVGRAEYLAGVSWMRRMLGEYLGFPAGQLRVMLNQRVADRVLTPTTDLRFSFVQAGSLALLALAFRQNVGVSAMGLDDEGGMAAFERGLLTQREEEVVARSHDPVRTASKMLVRRAALSKALAVADITVAMGCDVSALCPIEFNGRKLVDLYIDDDIVAAVALPTYAEPNLILDETQPKTQLPAVDAASDQPVAAL